MTRENMLLLSTGFQMTLLGASAVSVISVGYRAYLERYPKFAVGFWLLGAAFSLMCVRRLTALWLSAGGDIPPVVALLDQMVLPLAISFFIFVGISGLGRAYAAEVAKRGDVTA